MGAKKLISMDELTGTDNLDSVVMLQLDELQSFRNHPFKVLDNEDMDALVKSVKECGIRNPILVRHANDSGYEIISGHRRKRAAELAGLTEIPALVRDMDDDEAILQMVDNNLQRENILPSEKAWAYRMKLEAMKRQAGRHKINCSQVGNNLDGAKSSEVLAEQVGESKNQIFRYIRLTYLIPDLLNMVDSKKLPMNPAVAISYLTEEEQGWVLETIESEGVPSLKKAEQLKQCSKEGTLVNIDSVQTIMEEKKDKRVTDKVVLKKETLTRFFPKDWTPDNIETKIIEILEQWAKENKL